ncbi:ROK family protein [Serinibacter salmoneus]|uniref:Putative NBD/HSP70 family sugar kinase n=1 Tax=Serinibacter salmoneus TaxID=556530 RepID=A0A2A9D0P2_9MICO|nr:ROK family protein [Serinibacter salmoneus]PFG20257.1 putative NBD/HSP70 family sugar kinase [Serinibacter salmoneus]
MNAPTGGLGPRVGLDIGGTKTHAVLLGADGAVLAEEKRPSGHGAQPVLATASALVRDLTARAGIAVADLALVGAGLPGTVEEATGRVTQALNLGITDLDVAGELRRELGVAVHVENDVNAAALGVAAQRPDTCSLAYLNLGTGMAAGLVLRGELWRGHVGAAGEIGHLPWQNNGPRCHCGQRGCLELYASGSGIAAQWRAQRETDPPKASALPELAHTDALAATLLENLTNAVAAAVRLLVLTVDAQSVVVGGGMARMGPELLARVVTTLRSWELHSPFLASLEPSARVEVLRSTGRIPAIGAALGGRLAPQPSSGTRS